MISMKIRPWVFPWLWVPKFTCCCKPNAFIMFMNCYMSGVSVWLTSVLKSPKIIKFFFTWCFTCVCCQFVQNFCVIILVGAWWWVVDTYNEEILAFYCYLPWRMLKCGLLSLSYQYAIYVNWMDKTQAFFFVSPIWPHKSQSVSV